MTNTQQIKFRSRNQNSSEQSSSYRFSMANLEETHEAELDAILSELNVLEQNAKTKQLIDPNKMPINNTTTNHNIQTSQTLNNGRINVRNSNTTPSDIGNGSTTDTNVTMRDSRTDSPDNDSAFSDTVSLLSSESSTSSGISSSTGISTNTKNIHSNLIQVSEGLLIFFFF